MVLVAGASKSAALMLGPPSRHFRLAQVLRAPSKPAQALLLNRSAFFAYLYVRTIT